MEENISALVKKHLELLLIEREENLEHFLSDLSPGNLRNLERNGEALTRLVISNVADKGSSGFQLEFSKCDSSTLENDFSCGDIVLCLRRQQAKNILRGVIHEISDENSIIVSTNDNFDDLQEDELFCIVKTDSDVTYKSQTRALQFLENKDLYAERCFNIVKILFDNEKSTVDQLMSEEDVLPVSEFFNAHLAQDQKSAVLFALRKRHFAVIQGPPGTGKTTTLIELISQLRRLGKRVLVCAPTNVAVDNLVTRLGETEAKPVRLGHPSRIANAAQKFSLEALVEQDDGHAILKDIEKSIKDAIKEANSNNSKAKKNMRDIRDLRKEYKKRLAKLKSEILKRNSVMLCTLNSATIGQGNSRHLQKDYFDAVIVDEASQAMEASMWIAIPNAAKLVIAGDINQLPPVVMSQEAVNKGLGLSLMERAITKLGKGCFQRLTRQYRMHEKIMSWSSKAFYENTLQADDSVKNHLLKHLQKVEKDDTMTGEALIFIDTCGCECEELVTGNEAGSKGNPGEAVIVEKVVSHLVKVGVSVKDVGVITPYALQVNLIRKTLSAKSWKAQVSTVDGFQGREKEVIILSLVRSNMEKELGFVTDFRRLNVAVTRARRLLVIIADSETMEKNELISGLLKHVEQHGSIQTAEEYLSSESHNAKEEIEKSLKTNVKPKVEKPLKAKKVATVEKVQVVKQNGKEKTSEKMSRKKSHVADSRNYNVLQSIAVDESDVLEEQDEEKQVEKEEDIPKQETKEKEKTKPEKEEDFDKIIKEFKKSNNLCTFEKCKISTQLVRITCQFCKKWFCLQHGMQEIHGCGAAIRQKEQKEFRRSSKPAVSTQRDKQKLASKLKKMEEARKPKKKSASKT